MSEPRVALLIQSSWEYGRGLLCGIGAYAQSHGPWTIFHRIELLPERLSPQLRQWRPQGVLGQFESRRVLQQIRRLGVPAIDLFGLHEAADIPRFSVDHAAVARMAADYFLELGYRHFAFCGQRGVFYSQRRGEALVDYLHAKDCEVAVHESQPPPGATGVFEIESAGQWDIDAIGRWLRRLPKPTAVVAGTDMRARNVLEAARLYDVEVPREVAVLGVGNDEVLCNLASPPLSSIALESERIGRQAAALLDRMMRGEKPGRLEIATGPLCVVSRESTNALAIADPVIHDALVYLSEHLARGVTVSELARRAAVSPSTFQRRFHAALGRSPREQLVRLKLARIEQLLRDTDLSVARVATLSGFNYAECMMKFFKRKTGLAPSEFRRRLNHPADEHPLATGRRG